MPAGDGAIQFGVATAVVVAGVVEPTAFVAVFDNEPSSYRADHKSEPDVVGNGGRVEQ